MKKQKTKILATISIFSVMAINLVFVTPTYAAISGGALISMANSARAAAGVHQLSVNSTLTSSAYAKARDMLKYDYFAHTSPQGKSPWSFIRGAGYSYIYAGENLAIDFSSTSAVHNAWMASPTHRANILDKDFNEIGIAVATGEYQGRTTTVVVQHFGARAKVKKSIITDNQDTVSDFATNLEISSNQTDSQKETKKEITSKKIDLPEMKINDPKINDKKNNSLIWYSSPILAIINILR